MRRLNRYLFYALALFPILDFAIINIITILFFVSLPFDLKTFSKTNPKKAYFIILIFLLTLIPLFQSSFECSITYWLEKVAPLYIPSVLLLFAPSYITKKEANTFKNVYIVGAVLYVLRFAYIVIKEVYSGQLEVVSQKQFLFYSDIMNFLKPTIDVLDSNYHKPYFSLIILLALFFTTKKLIDEKLNTLNIFLTLFFLIAVIFPISLPNIAIVFAYLLYLIFILYKKKKILLSSLMAVVVIGITSLVLYNSFKYKNTDITEDIVFVLDNLKGNEEERKANQYNPRKIIYSALLNKIDEVPLLGYGCCGGKKTVTQIVEESITSNDGVDFAKNLLINTDQLESLIWKKNGASIESNKDNSFRVFSKNNDCKSHTVFQILDDLQIDETYTFSVSVKPNKANVVIRLGEINSQMVVFDVNTNTFPHIGQDIINHELIKENDDYYRLSITTKTTKSRNIALIGFVSVDYKYNHCNENNFFDLKSPQLEVGTNQTSYARGLSKNERNLLGSRINAHNVFLQEYYIGGIIGLLSIILLYGWFVFLGVNAADKVLTLYVVAIIVNSFFENIQFRQMGISIIIVVSVLLIFKRKE